jgi:lysophospholipase L1-like esterase
MWKITVFCLLAFLTACDSGSNNKAADSSIAVSSVSSVSSSSVATATGFTGNNSRLIGRFDRAIAGEARFTWPGSAIEFRFEGTEAKIKLKSTGRVRFVVDVDGVVSDLWVDAGEATYTLASNLAAGVHQIRLTRVIESFAVVTGITSDPIVTGSLLNPQDAAQKRLLVIGDSITAGYGVEGLDQNCHYAMETSNQQLSYAAVAAKNLGADLHAIAWSGIGAWRSYAEKTPVNPNILTRYQRTLADDPNSVWDVSSYNPDAILINIGTNDYWEGSVGDEYRQEMMNLINRVQNDYSGKPIYLIISPMLGGAARDSQQSVLNSFASAQIKLLDLGKIESADGLGCDYHPNTKTNNRMAAALELQLKTDLKW